MEVWCCLLCCASRSARPEYYEPNRWKNYLLQAPLDLQGTACSMWADTSLRIVPATSGLLVAEFDVSGFFDPHIAGDINSMLSGLGIDVNGPSSS